MILFKMRIFTENAPNCTDLHLYFQTLSRGDTPRPHSGARPPAHFFTASTVAAQTRAYAYSTVTGNQTHKYQEKIYRKTQTQKHKTNKLAVTLYTLMLIHNCLMEDDIQLATTEHLYTNIHRMNDSWTERNRKISSTSLLLLTTSSFLRPVSRVPSPTLRITSTVTQRQLEISDIIHIHTYIHFYLLKRQDN